MICHVCQKAASGQCRECLKFYCPQHGDGRSSTCARSPSTAPPGTEAVAPVFVVAADKCFRCGEPAGMKCEESHCGKRFCPKHGVGTPRWGVVKWTCSDCVSNRNVIALVAVAIVVFILWVLLVGRHR